MAAGYQVPVLMYHQVLREGVPVGRFDTWVREGQLRRQLAYLRRHGYRTCTFRDLARPAAPGERRVILTFDDGYEDNHAVLLPLLREFGATAVIFLVTGRRTNAWDVARGEPERRLLTPDQLRELAAAGVELGGHTRTHLDLDAAPPEVARAEIFGCRDDLQALLGVAPASFAYPHGAGGPAVQRLVAEAGFRWGVATRRGPPSPGDDPYVVRRTAVSHRIGMVRFAWKVSGRYHQPLHGLAALLGLGR